MATQAHATSYCKLGRSCKNLDVVSLYSTALLGKAIDVSHDVMVSAEIIGRIVIVGT
jgi:hypothetical protein